MKCKLNSSVGKGATNSEPDVLAVQQLLNHSLEFIRPLAGLKEDGVCGTRTVEAIRMFQERRLRMKAPDCRIDPGRATYRALIAHAGASPAYHAKSVSATKIPSHVEAFITAVLPGLRKVKANWNVPIAVCLAQAAIESGWGRHVKGNAYFGIKGKAPDGSSTAFATTEYIAGKKIGITDSFRAYANFEEAADDYGRFLNANRRYKHIFQHADDPNRFASELAKAGYATDPHYAAKIQRLISAYALDELDR
jgi:flagellar protein FlgJ